MNVANVQKYFVISPNFVLKSKTFYAVKQKQFTPNVGHELFMKLFVFMTIGAALSNFGFLFSSTRTMQSGDIRFLLCLRLNLILVCCRFELCLFKGNAHGHCLRNFIVGGFAHGARN